MQVLDTQAQMQTSHKVLLLALGLSALLLLASIPAAEAAGPTRKLAQWSDWSGWGWGWGGWGGPWGGRWSDPGKAACPLGTGWCWHVPTLVQALLGSHQPCAAAVLFCSTHCGSAAADLTIVCPVLRPRSWLWLL